MNIGKYYLETFKNKINYEGNNPKTPYFHHMMDVCEHIKRRGYTMAHDGSREDIFGKLKITDNPTLNNKQKFTLKFNVGSQISEEGVIDQVSNCCC